MLWNFFKTCLIAVAILPVVCRAADPFHISVTIEHGPDRGNNPGSLFEIVDPKGRVVAGAGFLGAYNTQPRSDRGLLQFFTRTPGTAPAWKVERMPAIDSPNRGFYPFSIGEKLYVVGRGGSDRRTFRWDEAGRTWVAEEIVPYTEFVAGRPLARTPDAVVFDGKKLLDTSGGADRLGEHYFANGCLIVRRYSSATPPANALVAYRWHPETGKAPAELDGGRINLTMPGEFLYACGQWRDHTLAISNYGSVLRFDGAAWSVLRKAVPNVSYQIYAALNYYDRLLLGQYPTGEIFEYAGGDLKHLAGWPPRLPNVSSNAREAQTLAIYGGDLCAGVWPWGEVWQYDRDRRDWHFARRMFTHPDPAEKPIHPYETETAAVDKVGNLWGQRVTGLVPFGRDLIITTSSKSGAAWEDKFAFLSPEQRADYGAIYRATVPGQLAVPTHWTPDSTTFEFSIDNETLRISQDGTLLGSLPLDGAAIARLTAGRATFGFGVFGPLQAKLVAKKTSLHVAEVPAQFRGAYFHPDRFFKPDSTSAEQERAWGEILDRFKESGLNVILPYFTGSSGQAYYGSRLVPQKVYSSSDPMRILMREARARGLQVYPVVCVAVCGNEQPAGILLEHPEWGLRHPDDTPLGYISPAHPAARDWLASVCREIAAEFLPDGLILDYIRFHNRPLRLDPAAEERFRASLPADCPADEEAHRLQAFKEAELTSLTRQIHQASREALPGLQVGAYVWGPHTLTNHLTAQIWPEWVKRGHLDLVNVSGYYHHDKYGDRFLDLFRQRMADAVKLSRAANPAVPVTIALGVNTSHGKVHSADDIRLYLKTAGEVGMNGFALFTWQDTLPYLDELNSHNDLRRFFDTPTTP